MSKPGQDPGVKQKQFSLLYKIWHDSVSSQRHHGFCPFSHLGSFCLDIGALNLRLKDVNQEEGPVRGGAWQVICETSLPAELGSRRSLQPSFCLLLGPVQHKIRAGSCHFGSLYSGVDISSNDTNKDWLFIL